MSDLDRLFYWRGIAADFYNYRGEFVQVPIENRLTLLNTMGVDTTSPKKISEAAYKLDVAPWLTWFPSLILEKEGESSGFTINIHPNSSGDEFHWRLEDESLLVSEGSFIPDELVEVGDYSFEGVRFTRRKVIIKNLPPGYYRLTVTSSKDSTSNSTTLAIAPGMAYEPTLEQEGKSCWGIIIQLYTLRTECDWGIGDFSSLKELIGKLVNYGAGTIGLNPLHSLLPDLGNKFSPYSPSDRRFLCTLYIDPSVEPEYLQFVDMEDPASKEARENAISRVRKSDTVLYEDVAKIKYPIFEKLFKLFVKSHVDVLTERGQAFLDYCEVSGDTLKMFALYEGVNNLWEDSSYGISLGTQEFDECISLGKEKILIDENKETILFHSYLQWVAHTQLGRAQNFAREQGMALGLIRDLAVGADGSGAEVSSNPELFCRGAAVGAPPDPLAEQGQNWGIPPMDPSNLRSTGFEHYINLLRENMSLCGALRIDHAMSMMRLWWCPPGMTADHGAYVYYPFEEMIGLLVLESQRNKCLIIGEDLGVVPDEFRQAMYENHIFSNKVFYFERYGFDRFKHPEDYEPKALAMVNNHDVPTLASWWNCSDLKLRDKLNIFEEGVTYEQMLEQRKNEKHQVLNLLEECDMLPETWQERNIEKSADKDLVYSVLTVGAKSASKIYVVQLEDLLMMEAPVNVPGTFREYPNWQRKMSKTLTEIFDNESVKYLLKEINQNRPKC